MTPNDAADNQTESVAHHPTPAGRTCGGCCGAGGVQPSHRRSLEQIADVERWYPDEWLAFIIPPGEDEYHPERGILLAHSHNDAPVWGAIMQVPATRLVHVYFNGGRETCFHTLGMGAMEADQDG